MQVVQMDCRNWYAAILPNQAKVFGWVTGGTAGERKLFIMTWGSEPLVHTLSTAHVLMDHWCVRTLSVQSSDLGQPGASAQLPVVGAPWCHGAPQEL